MRFISEQETSALVTFELAFVAARKALIAAAGDGATYPAVLGHGVDPLTRFSIKSGTMASGSGVKIGSFWPNNPARGLPRHSSLILLFDEATGRITQVLEASAANALRTAAADAVAATVLARQDSRVLAIFGAGNQAFHEVRALAAVRPIERVLVVSRRPDSGEALVRRLAEAGIAALSSDPREACAAADIVVTATPSREPLLEADWIRPGTYVAAMGADGPGKQELPPELLHRARLFCDLPSQSVVMGEFQSVAGPIADGALSLTAIGDVLTGRQAGRVSDDDITVFDSSGIALQDLALAQEIVSQLTESA